MQGKAPTDWVISEFHLYQLQVDVTPIAENGFAPIEQIISLNVPKNPLNLRYFPIMLAVLLAIGFVGGWVIGGRQKVQPGEIAPRRVRFIGLIYFTAPIALGLIGRLWLQHRRIAA